MDKIEPCFPRGGSDKGATRTVFDDNGDAVLATSLPPSRTNQKKRKSNSSGDYGDDKEKSIVRSNNKKRQQPVAGIRKAKSFVKKPESKQKHRSKVKDSDINKDSTSVVFTPERLSTKKITKGVMVLGAVREIRDYELRINLPNNVIGCVSVTNMADAYTGLLKNFAQSSQDMGNELHSLEELFTVGQILPCVCVAEAGESKLVQLSINPKQIHEHLTPHFLRQHSVLYGSVKGIEDHGYHIDIGIANITAFMPTSMVTDLYIGMVRRFRVTESNVMMLITGESRTVSVALQTEEDKIEYSATGADIQFNSIIPGSRFESKVYTRKTEGLVLQVGQIKGYAHVSHLSKHVKDYPGGEMVRSRVLAVNPSTKYIYLTALPSITDNIDMPAEGALTFPIGEPVTVQLKRIVDKYAFVTTDDGRSSYLGVSLLPEKVKDTKLNDAKLKCFWFSWDYLESRPVFSTVQPKVQKSVLPTLSPGDMVECKLVSFQSDGAKASLASGLHAFIQHIHLTEVPLKNPEKKLKLGQKLHCRILSVNMSTKRVRLTAKPSLVDSSLPVLSDLSTAKVGALVQGVIVKLTTGALISFYNNVVGFVSSGHLAKEPILKPANVFYIGQSVTCRVLSCDPDNDKMALTFILDGDVPSRVKRKSVVEESKAKRVKKSVEMTIGQVVKNWTVEHVADKSFWLTSEEGHRACLPSTQLSDMPGISDLLLKSVHVGSKMEELICIASHDDSYVVSNKRMFKYYAAKDGLAKNWENVMLGQMYPGYIQSKTDSGLAVCFGNDLRGLCPHRLLTDKLKETLAPGRSVLAKVNSKKGKQRMIVSLLPQECVLPTADSSLLSRMLAQNLADLKAYQKWSADNGSPVLRYSVGDLLKATITDKGDDSIELRVENDVMAQASGEQISGCKGKVGEVVTVMVMYVDIINGRLEVLIDKPYLLDRKRCLQKRDKTGCTGTQVKPGQQVKAEVIHLRQEYIMAILRGHANGELAYIPTMKHPNGSCETDKLVYAHKGKVTITHRDEENGLLVAVMQTEKEKREERAEKIRSKRGLPDIGAVVDAVIESKQDLQLNVKIGDAAGRVLLNEVDLKPIYAANPFARFEQGQPIRVKVIAVRMISATRKFRSVKDPSGALVMLDCSMRQCSDSYTPPPELVAGRQCACYVTKHDEGNFSQLVHVLTEGGENAVISWHQLGVAANNASELLLKFPVGLCLHAEYLTLSKNGVRHMRVVSPGKPANTKNSKDAFVEAIIQSYKPMTGLVVSTATFTRASVPPTEMVEEGEQVDPKVFTPGNIVRCRLVEKPANQLPVMSLRGEPQPQVVTPSSDSSEQKNGADKATSKEKRKPKKKEVKDENSERKAEVKDEDTGVELVFKKSRPAASVRSTLDFGAGLRSLQELPEDGGNALEQKLTQLEESGKSQPSSTSVKDGLISARSVKLAAVQADPKDTSQAHSEAEYLLLLKSSPNNASLWSKLIAFTATHKGVEAARARAEQALQTVSYRLENEKLMVWAAFLRLELTYGMEDTFDNVKRRAMQQMDELKVYQELVKLYTADNKLQEAEQCYTMMLRKWSDNALVWTEYGQFLFNHNKRDAARTLLQRCLKTLPTKQHIAVIMKFAKMELNDGDLERFTSLFENVISNFPKRTDVWSVYVDQLIKSQKYDNARMLLRRAVMQKWNAKKIQFFVKKFTDFEAEHGNEETLREAKELVATL